MISSKLDLSNKDKFMQMYTILKETGQANVLMRTKIRCLQSVYADVAASPSSPCLTPFSNDPQSK
jgi:hypothetical protein